MTKINEHHGFEDIEVSNVRLVNDTMHNGWMFVTLFYMASISSIILDKLNERGAFAKCAKLSTYEQDEGNML
jgi:hypothetical protein